MPANPYGRYVEGRDVLACLEQTSRRIDALVRAWPRERDERAHAPGKWTARQVLAHLAHIELNFSIRLRFTLAQDGYFVQPFEQDDWMRAEPAPPALVSLDAYVGMRRMNLVLLRSLSLTERARTARHPEIGEIDVDWLAAWCAGHELHHLPQIETVAST